MKPLQIGLLVLVGALGGALIMKFTQRPKPAPAPIASGAPLPSPVPAPPVPDVPATPAAPPAASSPVAEVMPNRSRLPRLPRDTTHPAVAPVTIHHSHPIIRTPQAETTVAQNQPPAPPAIPAEPPAAAAIQEPAAPAMNTETTPPPAPARSRPPSPPPPRNQRNRRHRVTLQSGMILSVRLGEILSSEHNQAGDTFTGTLDAPLSAGGFVIAERGAHVEGRVMEAQKAHVKGQARLALELTKLHTSDGQHVEIRTEILRKESTSMTTTDQVGVVAAAAGIGAVIGAMAGGGKGAAIGAGAGGAAGGGGLAATRNKPLTLPTESKLTFRLATPVTITEQLNR